jgi:Chaperone of endosialidase
MSTSFDFPLNPILDEIYILPDGSEAQWNGYAWVPVSSNDVTYPITIEQGGTNAITAPEALINLGLNTATGEFIVPDGNVTNPGLTFTNEQGVGWYRDSESVVNFAAQGLPVATFGANDPLSSSLGILPRAQGLASLNLYGNISGTVDMPLLGIGIDGRAGGSAYISSVMVGAGPAVPLTYNAPAHTFGGGIVKISGTILGISFDNVDTSAGNPIAFGWRSDATLGLRVDGSQFGSTWPISISGNASYATTAGSAPANGGTAQNSNQVNSIGGWAYRNDGNNPVYIWCSEGDAQSQHLTMPGNLSVNYANTAGYANNAYAGQDRCNNWGFASGNYNQPYMRLDGSDPIRLLIYQTYGNDTIGGIALTAITGGSATFEMSGTSGAWGITAAPSDERLKQNIVPATINATDIVNRITLKEYDIGDIHTTVGFSAQNLQTIDELMVFGVDQPEDSPMHEFGTILNPDIHRILAYVTKALQETIARLDLLENK